MDGRTGVPRCASAAVVALLLLALPAAGAEPAAPSARRADVTAELVAALSGERPSAPEIALRALDLSPEQRKQMEQLRAQHREEAGNLLGALDRAYAVRVREALGEERARTFDGVTAALAQLDAEVAAARAELGAAIGEEALEALPAGLQAGAAQPEDLAELSAEKRAALRRLRAERRRALYEALQQAVDPEARADPEAWKERRRQVSQAREEAREQFLAARRELFSAEELARLARAEEALAAYADRLASARQAAAAELLRLLGGSGGG